MLIFAYLRAAQGLHGFVLAAHGLFAAHGLHGFFAEQGLHGFFAEHGLHGLFAEHGFLALHGLHAAIWMPLVAVSPATAGASATVAAASATTLSAVTDFLFMVPLRTSFVENCASGPEAGRCPDRSLARKLELRTGSIPGERMCDVIRSNDRGSVADLPDPAHDP